MGKVVGRDKRGRLIVEPGEMAEKPVAVRLPREIDAIVRQMDNRNEFLREAIVNAVKNRLSESNEAKAS